MKDLKKIILAYDGFESNDPIPAQALHIAEESGAELLILNVISPPNSSFKETKTITVKYMGELIRNAREQIFKDHLNEHKNKNVKVSSKIRYGVAHIEIIREVIESSADLLIIMDHPHKRGDFSPFGKVTMKLFRKCPCPVWALRTDKPENFKNILASVDLGEEDSDKNRPNDRIMRFAKLMSGLHKSKLHIFHAWSLWGEELLAHPGRMTEQELDELLQDTKNVQEERLDQLIKDHGLESSNPELIVQKGDPDKLICNAVKEKNIDLLIMGTVSRSGLPGMLIGNTAESILNSVKCSVLTLKPADFQSPVVLE